MSQRARLARQQQRQRHSLRRVLGAAALVVVVASALVILISKLGSDHGSGDGSDVASGTLRISMTEFAFDPDPIVLQHGADARLDVVNDGTTGHDLVIGELGKGTPDLPPGQSMVLDLSGQPAGTYRVVCDLPGHTEAGMVTQLILR